VYPGHREKLEGVREEMLSGKLLRAYVVFMVCLWDMFAPKGRRNGGLFIALFLAPCDVGFKCNAYFEGF
jgi:hypothetical protein